MVTREDIARRSGTSVSVVSRALNNSGYVAKEKKERILAIAEELKYVKNPTVMDLQKNKTRQLLFYCKNLDNAFDIELYKGMLETALPKGYMVLFNGITEFENIRNLMVDGIILQDQGIAKYYLNRCGRNYHLPVVCASFQDNFDKDSYLVTVEVDMHKVVHTALDYLWENGHRRIAMGMPYVYHERHARAVAYRSWLLDRDITNVNQYYLAVDKHDPLLQNDERMKQFEEYSEEEGTTIPEDFFGKGVLAAKLFAERNMNATAVLGFNDEFALGMIRGFQEIGIRVPEDISVMGIDGIEARKYILPKLTTVCIMPREQGAKCAEVLIDIIEGKKSHTVNRIPFRLLKGDSVKRIR